MPDSWLARFDRATAEEVPELLLMILAAKNKCAHLDSGVPLMTDSEIRLQLLEERLEAREVARRADAGDKSAIRQLVHGRAQLELAVERAKARVAEEERQLRSAITGRPAYAGGVGLHWPPPEIE